MYGDRTNPGRCCCRHIRSITCTGVTGMTGRGPVAGVSPNVVRRGGGSSSSSSCHPPLSPPPPPPPPSSSQSIGSNVAIDWMRHFMGIDGTKGVIGVVGVVVAHRFFANARWYLKQIESNVAWLHPA